MTGPPLGPGGGPGGPSSRVDVVCGERPRPPLGQAAGSLTAVYTSDCANGVQITSSGSLRGLSTTALQRLGGVDADETPRTIDLPGLGSVRVAATTTPDGTVAILFSDIEGSTALNHELGDGGWVRLLAKHDAVATRAVGRHGGHVVKTQGDGFMVAFPSATAAVAAAGEVQRRITRARPGSRLAGVAVRIGVHRGSAVHRDGDLFGRNVAYAARVAAQADGGEVLVSDTVLEALEADGTPVPVLESREVDLKGIPGTQVVHALDWQV